METRHDFGARLRAKQRLLFFFSILGSGNGEQEDFRALCPIGYLQRSLFAAFDKYISSDDLAGSLLKLPGRVCDRATNLAENLLEIEGAEVTPENQQTH